jgi:transcriptional regulator with XRE-family HTH domain
MTTAEATSGDPERFGRWLDLTMSNRGIKGRDIAKRLKVHDSAVSRWRSGRATPGLDTAVRLAKILDVDPLQLAVTGGLLDGEATGVKPLPMPEPTAARKAIKDQILAIRGLSAQERQHLLNAYDEVQGG